MPVLCLPDSILLDIARLCAIAAPSSPRDREKKKRKPKKTMAKGHFSIRQTVPLVLHTSTYPRSAEPVSFLQYIRQLVPLNTQELQRRAGLALPGRPVLPPPAGAARVSERARGHSGRLEGARAVEGCVCRVGTAAGLLHQVAARTVGAAALRRRALRVVELRAVHVAAAQGEPGRRRHARGRRAGAGSHHARV